MKSKEARTLIGKRVTWWSSWCDHRGTYNLTGGTLEAVKGRNVCIDGDWRWLPDLKNFHERRDG